MGSVSGSGRSPGGGNENSLQYSCLENPMDRGAWRATVHGIAITQNWSNLACTQHISVYDLSICRIISIFSVDGHFVKMIRLLTKNLEIYVYMYYWMWAFWSLSTWILSSMILFNQYGKQAHEIYFYN